MLIIRNVFHWSKYGESTCKFSVWEYIVYNYIVFFWHTYYVRRKIQCNCKQWPPKPRIFGIPQSPLHFPLALIVARSGGCYSLRFRLRSRNSRSPRRTIRRDSVTTKHPSSQARCRRLIYCATGVFIAAIIHAYRRTRSSYSITTADSNFPDFVIIGRGLYVVSCFRWRRWSWISVRINVRSPKIVEYL